MLATAVAEEAVEVARTAVAARGGEIKARAALSAVEVERMAEEVAVRETQQRKSLPNIEVLLSDRRRFPTRTTLHSSRTLLLVQS